MSDNTLQQQAQAMVARQTKLAETLKSLLKDYGNDLDKMNQEFLEGLNKLRQEKMSSMEDTSRKSEDPEKILSQVTDSK